MDAFLRGCIRERGGREGAGEIMEAPGVGDKQPHRRSASASLDRETKGQREQLGKETKNPNGSAASLPGDSQAAPRIYEAGGRVLLPTGGLPGSPPKSGKH